MAYIIAEIGVNHNGDMETARILIRLACGNGADAVKFQLFDAEKLEPPGERRDMLKGLQLSKEQILELKEEAKFHGADFICTPFDVDSLKYLAQIGVDYIKISSADIGNARLLMNAAICNIPIIMSMGMATTDEVYTATDIAQPDVLMHCTSSYPCPPQDVNLRVITEMLDLDRMLGIKTGFSDHTLSTVIPAAAVALGATFIEKHLTLDRSMEGPDHKASIEPDEFREMVRNIREVEVALGDGIKRPMPSELAVMKVRDERAKWRAR